MNTVISDETSFCYAVYDAVLKMTGREDDLLLKNQVLAEAAELFEGKHRQGTCRDREKAAKIIYEALEHKQPSQETVEKAFSKREEITA